MAKYTLSLSEICQYYTKSNVSEMEGNPFDYIDSIIERAVPILFSSKYHIYDDGEERLTLLKKIIEHYWEYEVCTYTPADFILRINRKLNEIMPYYNQMYESTKIKFPIFDDTHYNRTEHTSDNDITTDDNNTDSKHTGVDTDNTAHTGQDVSTTDKSGEDTTSHNLETDTKGDFNGTQLTNAENSGTLNIEGDNSNTNKHTGTDTTTLDGTVTADGTTTNKGTLESNKTNSNTSETSGSTNSDTTTTQTKGGTEWIYRNDTPQGTISGIRDTDYLTSYEKHTKEEDTDVNNNNTNTTNKGTTTDNGTNTQSDTTSNNGTSKETTKTDNTNTTEYNSTINDNGTHNETQTSSGTATGTTNDQQVATGKETQDGTDTITYGNKTQTTNELGTNYDTEHHYDSNLNTKTDNTRNYLHDGYKVYDVDGKMSQKSYSELMNEFRATMLNIDNMVIDELKELFFIIY